MQLPPSNPCPLTPSKEAEGVEQTKLLKQILEELKGLHELLANVTQGGYATLTEVVKQPVVEVGA